MKSFTKVSGLTIFSLPALAEAQDHAINWWHLGSEYSEAPALGWLFITFFIFVFGLTYVVKKPLGLYLETRSKDIKRQIEEGRLAKLESEAKLKAYDEKLKTLDQEIDHLRKVFSEQAQAEKREKERLLNDLRARIEHETSETIKASYEKSKNQLAREVVEKAMVMAEAMIGAKKQQEIDESLKSSFIEDLTWQISGSKKEGSNGASKKPFVDDFKASAPGGH